MPQRAFDSVKEANEALAARGLYPATSGSRLYIHPRFDYPFMIEFEDHLTPRERGILVENTIEKLEAALEALKEMP